MNQLNKPLGILNPPGVDKFSQAEDKAVEALRRLLRQGRAARMTGEVHLRVLLNDGQIASGPRSQVSETLS